MNYESEEAEILSLRKEQAETLQKEVFGGLSRAERTSYDRRHDRISELQRLLNLRDRHSKDPVSVAKITSL